MGEGRPPEDHYIPKVVPGLPQSPTKLATHNLVIPIIRILPQFIKTFRLTYTKVHPPITKVHLPFTQIILRPITKLYLQITKQIHIQEAKLPVQILEIINRCLLLNKAFKELYCTS